MSGHRLRVGGLLLAAGAYAFAQAQPESQPRAWASADTSAHDPALTRQLDQLRERAKDLETRIGGLAQAASVRATPNPGCSDCASEMGQMATASAIPQSGLPGFPGAARIYHVGAESFFLNHALHVGLSVEQQTRLGQIREQALMSRATAELKIDEADQQLFVLTAADQPDAQRIEAQVRRIEALRTARRLAYIRAVGEASQVLTEAQRRAVPGPGP